MLDTVQFNHITQIFAGRSFLTTLVKVYTVIDFKELRNINI